MSVEEPTDVSGPNSPVTSGRRGSRPFHNGLAGGLAGLVLSFLPLSTVLAGAVAGYLEGGTYADGARAGAVAGVVVLVPLAALGLAVAFAPGLAVPGPSLPVGAFVAAVAGLALAYVVGLSVLGGVLGVSVRSEGLE